MKKNQKDNEINKPAFIESSEDQQAVISRLKESEKFSRLLFEKSPIGMATLKLDGYHIEANQAYMKILGMNLEEIRKTAGVGITPAEYLERDREHQGLLFEKGNFGPYEKELIRKDGKRINVRASGVLLEKENEKIILMNLEDITQQKENEKLLIERERLFTSLYENSHIGFYRTTPDGKILLANPTLVKMLGYSSYEEFSSRNLEIDKYEPKYHRRDFKDSIEERGEIKGWEDTWLKKDGSEVFIRESARAVRNEQGNILYYEGTVEDVTESKIALKALKESEEIYRTVFATVDDALFITSMDSGQILYCNGRLSGYEVEELVGKSTIDLKLWVNDDDRKNVIELIKKNGSVSDYEADFRRKDGSIFTGSISINFIRIGGNNNLISGIRDISQRKKYEKELKQSEEKFRSAFYISPDSVNINRLSDGMYVSVNRGYTQLTGYTEEEVIGKTSAEINIWANPEDRLRLVEGLKKDGMVSNLEAGFRIKDGSIKYALMSASLLELNGIPHIINITRDITERKEAEKKQWELREELHTTLYSIGDAVISTDKDGKVRQMNPIAEQLTGWRELEARNRSLSEVFDIVCEEDGAKVDNPVEKVINEGVIVGLANHTVLISRDGNRRPIADSGAPIRDKDGNITGVVMVFRDQTEERRARETLQRNEERMRAIVEGTPNLFFYTQDKDANTIYVSSTVEKITGYTIEEWQSRRDWFITDSKMNENAIVLTHKHLTGDFSENTIVLEVKHAKGFPIVLEIFEYPIYKDGKIIGLQGIAHDVTRRFKAEYELQKTNETLNTIISSSPLAIIATDLKGEITLWNPAAENFFGWRESETLGVDINNILTSEPDENLSVFESLLNRAVTNYEVRRKKKDGSIIDVSVSSVILHDADKKVSGILSLFVDITSRKKYEENLKKLYQATEQSPVSIVITDVKGSIEYVNPNLSLVSGYSFNEVIGRNPKIFKSGDKSKEEYEELWRTILSGKQWKGEFCNKKKDGSIFWESASISPIRNDKGEITHFIAVKEDITDKRKIVQELILAKTRAEDANKTKDLFLANMSHELRTPLIGILGYSDLLIELIEDPEKVEMAKGIKRSGKRLLNTLNMILNFTKIEAEMNETNFKPTNLAEELDSVYKMFYGAAIEKHLEFRLEVESPGIIINVDPTFFSIVMENLVNNAIKFTSSGFIKIVAGKLEEGSAYIKVIDSGIGIDEQYFDIIFQEFRQVSEGINREFQGTGLGLSISRKYVEMMNGKIRVESTLDGGSTFTVVFPMV